MESKKVDGFKKKMQKDKNIVGVWFEETYTRDYPLKTVGCNIIGFMSSENQGTYGVDHANIPDGKVLRCFGRFLTAPSMTHPPGKRRNFG